MAAKIQKAFDRYCKKHGKKDWAEWLAWKAIDEGDQQCLQIAASKAIPNAPQDFNLNHTLTPTEDQLELIELQRAKLHAELRALDNRSEAGPTIDWRKPVIVSARLEGGNGHAGNGKG